MARIYIIDAVGLAKLAIIYHKKMETHQYFTIIETREHKYITSETSILNAFEILARLHPTTGVDALMRIIQFFFDDTAVNYAIERKLRAHTCLDYGHFSKNTNIDTPLHIKDTSFLAYKCFPGAAILGDNHPLYQQLSLSVIE